MVATATTTTSRTSSRADGPRRARAQGAASTRARSTVLGAGVAPAPSAGVQEPAVEHAAVGGEVASPTPRRRRWRERCRSRAPTVPAGRGRPPNLGRWPTSTCSPSPPPWSTSRRRATTRRRSPTTSRRPCGRCPTSPSSGWAPTWWPAPSSAGRRRVVLAGHTDTVPANGNAPPGIDGDVLWGLGSADMKGGPGGDARPRRGGPAPSVDVTFVFYAGEEVAAEHNGLAHLLRDRPELLAGDVAILGEPTDGELEAGCQGTLRIEVTAAGRSAPTRPDRGWAATPSTGWARVLRLVEGFDERAPVIQGCRVPRGAAGRAVSGGVAGNVVPDRGHRHAQPPLRARPHRGEAEAARAGAPGPGARGRRRGAAGRHRAGGRARPRRPGAAGLVDDHRLTVRPSSAGPTWPASRPSASPACNLGPGDATLAHPPDERVDRARSPRLRRAPTPCSPPPPPTTSRSTRASRVEARWRCR